MAPPPDNEPGNGTQSSRPSRKAGQGTPDEERKEGDDKGDKRRDKIDCAEDCGKSPCDKSGDGTGGGTSGSQTGGGASGDGTGGGTNTGGESAPGVWRPELQFALAIAVVLVVAVLVLFPPIYTSHLLVDAGIETAGAMSIWAPMLAVLIGLTTVTISGIFLFMTFRIDRGTERTAREVADEKAGKVAEEVAEKTAKKIADEQTKDLRSRICKLLEYETKANEAADRMKKMCKEIESLLKETKEKLDGDPIQQRVYEILFDESDQSLVQRVVRAVLEQDPRLQRRVQRLTTTLVNRLRKDERLDQLTRDVLFPELDKALFEAVADRALKDHPTEELEERLHALMSALDKWWFPPWTFWRRRAGRNVPPSDDGS